MNGNVLTELEIKEYQRRGYLVGNCRLCGESILFPATVYNESDIVKYECSCCRERIRLNHCN